MTTLTSSCLFPAMRDFAQEERPVGGDFGRERLVLSTCDRTPRGRPCHASPATEAGGAPMPFSADQSQLVATVRLARLPSYELART